jgi:transcriptional repressor NrdR
MRCPSCRHQEDKVLDTRVQKDGEVIRRRRECLECQHRFTTQESLVLNFPMVIKKGGAKEPFIKTKIANGIQLACQKRPVPLDIIDQMVEKISQWALENPEKEISSQIIGQHIMNELKNIDDVAYVRFASVYKNFKDASEFVKTLNLYTQALEEPKPKDR